MKHEFVVDVKINEDDRLTYRTQHTHILGVLVIILHAF